MNHYAITMPQLSDTMTEGVVVTWEKQPGDKVERGDIVATVETDKAIMDVEVFKAGYLAGPLAEVGATIPVGGALGYITDTPGDLAIQADEVVEEKAQTEMIPHHAGTPIVMPQLSDTMTEGVVVSWEKEPGDAIKRGDIVATVETDKAIMDVEVFQEGFLSGPLADVGSVVEVGHPMAFIVTDKSKVNDTGVTIGADHKVKESHAIKHSETPRPASPPIPKSAPATAPAISHPSAAPAPRVTGRKVSPYARKLAGQMGIDLKSLAGSGPEGTVIAADVARARPSMAEVAHSLPQVDVPGAGRPMTSMEKAVSHAMTASLTLPTFNVTMNIDTGKLTKAAKAQGVSVTVAIAKACSVAMAKFPRMNWAYQPVDKLVERANHDFGVAVKSDDGGLVVPILNGIEHKSLAQLQSEWNDLVPRARIRKLAPREFANPTFTISNMGMFGVTHFTAIPTPGIAAILAIAANGPQGTPFTITADHRVLNGADVAAYLAELKQVIEAPEAWMSQGSGFRDQGSVAATPSFSIPEGSWDYPVVVIGGGPGGEDCARDLADHGVKVALVHNEPFPGGECLWRGCIPSKAWRAAADIIRNRAHDAEIGITGTDKPAMDWAQIEKHRRWVQQSRGEMALKTDKGMKIDVIEGFGEFVDAHTVKVASPDGAVRNITFGAAVIATGAPAFVPPIPGARENLATGGVVTSDTIWNLANPPRKMAIVGGGVIGVEMAQIFRDFGCEVLMLERNERILAEVEEEIAKTLIGLLEKEITVVTNAGIDGISGNAYGAMQIAYKNAAGEAHRFDCDVVLMATGKRPDTSKLNLDKAGVELDGAAIKVNSRCQTSQPHIFAVGDVIGGYMLAHTAATQGRVAADTILGHDAEYDQDKDCAVTFSRPQAGFVGLSVAQAKAKGIDAVEAKMPMSIDAKAMITGETEGMIKLVADKASGRIIGVHFLADHTDTLIGAGVMMVAGDMTLTQVAKAIFPHPTQTELFGELARRILARLRRTAKR